MKQLIVQLSFIFVWINLFHIDIDAQSNSSLKEKAIKAFDTCKNSSIIKDTIFYPDNELGENKNAWIEVDEAPEFPGGPKALIMYITNKMNYPQSAVEDSIYGRVLLRFIVNEYGCTDKIQILKSVRDDLDNESIRVIKGLPRFKPGTILTKSSKGWYMKPTNVWYLMPINFLLNEDKKVKGVIIMPKIKP